MHFGGDEVGDCGCWSNDNRTMAWARQQGSPFINGSGLLNVTAMHLHFEIAVANAAVANGARPVFWMESWMGG